jgi:hypothetical protein
MSNQILIKRTSTPGKAPVTTDLSLGELTINTNDGILFFKKSVLGVETVLSLNPATAGLVTSVNGSTGAVIVSPASIGAINTNQIGVASGVASLNASGKLTAAQLPVASTTVLGGVKQGANVTIAGDGTVSVANPYDLITSVDNENFAITAGGLYLDPQVTVNAVNIRANSSFSIPPPSTLALFAQTFSNKGQLAYTDSNGAQETLQRAIYSNNITMWLPNSGNVVYAPLGTTWLARNSGGGAGQSKPTISNTNVVTQMNRNVFGTGTNASGASGIVSTDPLVFIGNNYYMGGFFLFARFALETYLASERFFIGLSASNAALNGNPSVRNNSVGIGKDSTDTTIQFITRGATSVTKTNTTLIPDVSKIYDFYLYCLPNSSVMQYTIMNPLDLSYPLATGVINTNTPVANTNLYLVALIQSTAGTTAKQLALTKLYLETEI